jgi:acyl carrier protein
VYLPFYIQTAMSLGLVDMILEIEEKCGFRFEAEQMQSPEFRTIGGVIATSEKLVREHANV